jgi:MFS family permease
LGVIKSLACNKVFVILVVGVSLTTFALGGMSDWFPTYMQEVLGMDEDDAGLYAGATTFFGGLFGTVFGGWLAEKMVTRVKNSYLALSGYSVLIAAILSTVIIAIDGPVGVIVFLLFITQFCLWASVGPSNALAANVVPALHRARAFGVLVFFQHAFGDAASPTILGLISDVTSLRFAACLIPLVWYIAGTVFVAASRFLDEVQLVKLEEEVEEIAESL